MKPKPILLIPTARIPQVTYLRDRPRPITPALPAGHIGELIAVPFDRNRVATRERSTSQQILRVFVSESQRGTQRRVLT